MTVRLQKDYRLRISDLGKKKIRLVTVWLSLLDTISSRDCTSSAWRTSSPRHPIGPLWEWNLMIIDLVTLSSLLCL